MGLYDDAVSQGFDRAPDDPFNPPRPKPRPWFDLEDVALAVPRGAIGAVKGVYNLADTVTGDALPDWNENPLGESKSFAGSLVEGAVHFTAGFIPFGGGLGFAGLLPKLAEGAGALAAVGRVAAASAGAGFLAFEGHEARLSDLVERYPALQNPVTAFLASDGNDPELLGRLKNAIEQAGMGAAAEGLILGVKAIARGRVAKTAALEAGKSAEAADAAGAQAAAEVASPEQMIAVARREQGLDPLEATGAHEHGITRDERIAMKQEAPLLEEPTAAELADPEMVKGEIEFRRDAMRAHPELTEQEAVDRFFTEQVEEAARIAEQGDALARKGTEGAKVAPPPAPAGEPIPGVSDTPERAARAPILRRLGLDDAGIKRFTAAFEEKSQAIEDVVGPGAGLPGETAFNPRGLSAAERARLGLLASDLPMQNFRSPDAANVLQRTVEDLFRTQMEADFKALEPTTLAKIAAESSSKTAEMLGFKDPAAYRAATQVRAGKTLASLEEALPLMQSDRAILELSSRQLAKTFKVLQQTQVGDVASQSRAAVEFTEALQHLAGMQAAVKGQKALAGRILRAMGTEVGGVEMPAELMRLADDPIRLQQTLAEAGGLENVTKVMRKYEAAWNLAGEEGGDAALHKLARGSYGKRFLDMTTEFFMGSVLSSPQTWVVNGASNALAQLYLPLERALGSAMIRLSGGRLAPASELALQAPIVRESFAQISASKRALVDAVRMFKESGWSPESRLTNARIYEQGGRQEAISAANLGLAPGTFQARMADWFGTATRTPMKILGGTDVVAKNVYYRAAAWARFETEAIQAGMTRPLDIAAHAERRLGDLVLDGQAYTQQAIVERGVQAAKASNLSDPAEIQKFVVDYYTKNFDPTLDVLSKELVHEANVATWTNRAAPGTMTANIQNFVNQHPALKLVAPFINTPMNLLKGAGQRADAVGVTRYIVGRVWPKTMPEITETSNRFLQDMLSRDPRRAADAVGRISAGMGAAVFFTSEALSGNITGRGPADPEQRQALIDTGWQPYSIRVGDAYISYQRLDPFATFMGTAADMAEYMNHAADVDDEDHATALTGLAVGMANNFTNKSYLTGFANLIGALQAPEKKVPEFFRRQASAFVPNIFGTAGYGVAQDPNMREVNGFVDAMMAKIPYFSKQLPPRRNILGEPLERPRAAPGKDVAGNTLLNLWDPIKYSRVKDDVVRNELAALGHSWEPPKRRTNGVDLMEVPSGSTTAYDRWQELQGTVTMNGMTLRDALRREIKSASYRQLTPESVGGLESPRVGRLSRIVNDYRSRAWDRLLKETPALKAHDTAFAANKHRLRAGLPAAIIPDLETR